MLSHEITWCVKGRFTVGFNNCQLEAQLSNQVQPKYFLLQCKLILKEVYSSTLRLNHVWNANVLHRAFIRGSADVMSLYGTRHKNSWVTKSTISDKEFSHILWHKTNPCLPTTAFRSFWSRLEKASWWSKTCSQVDRWKRYVCPSTESQ